MRVFVTGASGFIGRNLVPRLSAAGHHVTALLLRAVGRTYNLNHPQNPTWNEFVEAVAGELGVPPPRRHLPYTVALAAAAALELAARLRGGEPRLTRYAVRVVGRAYDYRVDRARDELGFAPRVDLREGVRRYFAA